MLTLIHARKSRSTAILTLIEEMGIADKIAVQEVSIRYNDGSGALDPNNPHPEGKAPALLHGGHVITERAAIMLHLTSLFPSPLAPPIGTAEWGAYAGWMVWYQGVMEPVLLLGAAGISHPFITATFRGMPEALSRIRNALDKGPWLLGQDFSAADILVSSPFLWRPEMAPQDARIQDWIARVAARPARALVIARDAAPRAD